MKSIIKTFQVCCLLFVLGLTACNAQSSKIVGGPCEGCEAIDEYGDKKLTATDTLPEFKNNEPKLKITGTVFEKDGETAAENVVLYIYHTNREGIYEKKGNEKGWAKRHGFIRGWVKTEKDGKYTFYTFRPAAYPGGSEPEHIHIIVKEPGKNEYYLDDYLFDDDPILSRENREKSRGRGGSGIMKPKEENGILTIERNIILGKNIPNYE
ncbi:intradiol ring-cleavage dioxygenase [Marivirga sp. S37H4]|uniref:Intradiol ring-cleavage dioxygenase n=1 Tax=Marivirga aurantiaca TaxID=2802615 RepID=A0A935C7M5_9BACT|nr:intradiol ring-cleavage dioxygenase [Marivirga aurantiaca]MBK6265106.1 intradiol ring-cleavage dioxygenase [Marivirga aurantiaca]